MAFDLTQRPFEQLLGKKKPQVDIYQEIKACADQLKNLIAKNSDIKAVQSVQLRLQVLYNNHQEERKSDET